MAITASRLADQIWSIRDTSLQAYLGTHAAGGVQRIAAPSQASLAESQGAVAVFRVEGVLVPKAEWFGEVGSFALASALQAATHNDDIQAGVLWIDSPGGACHGMLELVQAAADFAKVKTLVAHVSGCCCSAAYHLASQAEQIFAGPRDDIGSIGTRSLLYDYSKYFSEMGVEAVTTDTGPIKSLGVIGTLVSEEQRAFLQSRVDYLQEDFRSNVMRGRDMTAEQFATIATGEWWFGEEAVSLGLIDGVQTHQETFAGLESAHSKSSKKTVRSKVMSEEPKTTEVATLEELESNLPGADASFIMAQLKAKATLPQAMTAHMSQLQAANEKAETEKEEAENRAEAAEKKAKESSNSTSKATKKKGNTPVSSGGDDTDEETTGDVNYVEMAKQTAKSKGISYRQAAHLVQKQHGNDARNAFKRGPLVG